MRLAPTLSWPVLTLLASIIFVAFYNVAFWHAVSAANAGSTGFLISLALVLVAVVNLLLSLLTFGRTGKVVLGLLFVLSALAAYFTNEYGVMINAEMVQNVVETDVREAGELFSVKLVGYVAVLGILPVALLFGCRVARRPLWREALGKLGGIALSLALMLAAIFPYYPDYASMARNHRELRYLLAPTNYVQASFSFLKKKLQRPIVVTPIGEDARLGESWHDAERLSVAVLVVGETARAADFSLGGYGRETNPELKQEDVVYFDNVTSCGTETAVSVPCMFSNLGRDNYSDSKAKSQQGLLDVLHHAGLSVLWLDNNSGCKGTCDRVDYIAVDDTKSPFNCGTKECFDETLVKALSAKLDTLRHDTVIVLHQKGSHGPAYHLRYPENFATFTPVCQTNELQTCTREQLVNAYDNTIRYTDHVLASVIKVLKQHADRVDASMLYVSDHGESLGESNLYLHGTPYLFAPAEQTHIPMLVWMSAETRARSGVDWDCLKGERNKAFSHDNLFHSMLGVLDVETSVYQADKDLFHACRQPATLATQ